MNLSDWIFNHPVHMAFAIGVETILVFTFVIMYGRWQIKRGRW